MNKHVNELMCAFFICRKSKVEHQKSLSLMQSLSTPEWKWDIISIDFVSGLLRTAKGCDTIWVVVDSLTKSAYLILS